jgi:nucleoside-diphosphate-sugar epimerase
MTTALTAKRVFVTGGTGFLGRALVDRLVADGVHVVALARSDGKAERLKEAGAEAVLGDLTDLDSLRKGMRGCEIVFHSAAALDGSYAEMFPATVTGTRHVMEAAADMQVHRVVHVSSVAVYGLAGRRELYEETTPLAPAEYPYITTKQLAEAAVRREGSERGLAWTMIRPGMIYGPRAGLWTKGMFQLASQRPTVFPGRGQGTAFPIFVSDVIDMLLTVAVHPQAEGEVFNCVMDPSPTWREYIAAYQVLTANTTWLAVPEIVARVAAGIIMMVAPRQSVLRDLPDGMDWLLARKHYSMENAQRLLGWAPRVSLEEGIAASALWLREIGLLKGKTVE